MITTGPGLMSPHRDRVGELPFGQPVVADDQSLMQERDNGETRAERECTRLREKARHRPEDADARDPREALDAGQWQRNDGRQPVAKPREPAAVVDRCE